MNTILNNALLVSGGMLVGLLFGWLAGNVGSRRKDAPVPPMIEDVGYDPHNPVNCGKECRRGETVEVCGKIMYRM